MSVCMVQGRGISLTPSVLHRILLTTKGKRVIVAILVDLHAGLRERRNPVRGLGGLDVSLEEV